jgi:hypothetical protein
MGSILPKETALIPMIVLTLVTSWPGLPTPPPGAPRDAQHVTCSVRDVSDKSCGSKAAKFCRRFFDPNATIRVLGVDEAPDGAPEHVRRMWFKCVIE